MRAVYPAFPRDASETIQRTKTKRYGVVNSRRNRETRLRKTRRRVYPTVTIVHTLLVK